jgi:hypothetical protein
MKNVFAIVAAVVGLVACSRDDVGKTPPPTPKSAPSAAPAASGGAPGAGDRSGSSIANAKALVKGTPTTFTVPCDGSAVYVGPFTLTRDPEKLAVRAEAKGTSKAQVCMPDGHWVDAKGGNPSIASVPCVEDGKPAQTTLQYEYSPGNGGSNVTPVYWRIKHESAKPAGCDTITVTLTL